MLKIEKSKLETFITALSALVPECRMTISDTGLVVRAVDTANVAMAQAHLPNTAFTEFRVEKGDVGLDIQKWKGAIAVMKSDATIEIDFPKGDRVTISDGSYSYKIAPLDINTVRKSANVPAFQLPCSLEIDATEFADAVKAMGVVGDKVRFALTGSSFELSTEGDTDSLRKEIPGTVPDGKKNDTKAVSLFSLDYLKDISKPLKAAGKVTVHLGIDHPVRFDFMAGETEAAYVLAPRIDQEDAA